MNAAQLSRSPLLAKLRDFYGLIVRLKGEIERDGDDVTVERVQGELRSFMDEQLRSLGETPDEVGYHLYEAMRYVMVALADDQFLHMQLQWGGRARWLTNLLEKQVFGTQRAGAAFFDRIDELLASRDKSKEEVATAYLIALLLGFKGRFRGHEEDEVVAYRERLMYFVGLGQSSGMDPGKPFFPDAYAHTINKEPSEKMPDHGTYLKLLVIVIIGYLGLAHAAWYVQTDEIRRIVRQIDASKVAEQTERGR
ncbi:MAG: DotU family type IV/VI secretion system protein [Myxococcales bacterium]|nr:DotU family type IV/VI secretion system protein [Myxococcales bacterium]